MGNCDCKKYCYNEQGNQNLALQEIATNDDYRTIMQEQPECELQIKVRTWQKESFSLFDYENQNQLKEQIFSISNGGYLIRNNNDLQWMDDEIDWGKCVIKQDQVLFRIRKHDGKYAIINTRVFVDDDDMKQELMTKCQGENKDFQQSENLEHVEADEFHQGCELVKNASMRTNTKLSEKGSKLWLVLRSFQQIMMRNGVKIKEGDVIKMGRVKFKVREINLNPKQIDQQYESFVSSHTDAIYCRMCYSSSYSRSNPLINPCKCSGSIKYIHMECLKKWLKSKLQSRQSDCCTIYMWKSLECELCKFNYPPVFKSDDAFYDLVELSKPTNQAYVLLEITQKRYEDQHMQADESQQWSQCNGVYIISFEHKRDLRIGRANETDIRVNDISVSRNHATLKLNDGQLYIQDNKSKFGTLLLIQQPKVQLIKEFNGIELQIGRSVIQMQLGNSVFNQFQVASDIFDQLVGFNDDDEDN